MKYQKPNHGCSRCIWWKYERHDGWGYCMLFQEKSWYQAPPCVEYELEPGTPDVIEADLQLI